MRQFFAGLAASQKALRKDGIEKLNKELDAIYALKRSTNSSSSSSSSLELTLLAVYGYDTGSRRCVRTVAGDSEGLRWSTWDGWQQTEEFEDEGSPSYPSRKAWFRGRGLTDTLGFATTSDGTSWTRYALIQGSLGTVVAAYTPQGAEVERYEYDPYGLRYGYKPDGSGGHTLIGGAGSIATEISQHDSASGGRDDWETGLVYLRNRYLVTSIGRFMSIDPLGGWADGASWGNGYVYAINSPVTASDATGLFHDLAGMHPDDDIATTAPITNDYQTRNMYRNIDDGPTYREPDPASSRCVAECLGLVDVAAQTGGGALVNWGEIQKGSKPFVTPGSAPGTSRASVWCRKNIPNVKLPFKLPAPVATGPKGWAKMSCRLPVIAGRLVPVVGAIIMISDAIAFGSCVGSCLARN